MTTLLVQNCTSLTEVRSNIDRIDQDIVALIAQRGQFVAQAAKFKKDAGDVKAPQRVEQVIEKVRKLATEQQIEPTIVEAVYRAMIAAFIKEELAEHAKINRTTTES